MAKRKKKKNSQNRESRPAKPQPFNNPFEAVKKELRATANAVSEAPAEVPPPRPESAENDAEAFSAAMLGVEPLDPKAQRMRQSDAKPPRVRLDDQLDEDLEVMAQLADLIEGSELLDLRLTGQFCYGAAPGVGEQLMERLAEGAFPIQDYLDLHGLGVDEALQETERFIAQASTRGLRHVLIVHGKGKGSPGGVPLLKNQLSKALCNKRFQRRVLAFCTARNIDGGSGAMYVLLRKWSGPKGAWPTVT